MALAGEYYKCWSDSINATYRQVIIERKRERNWLVSDNSGDSIVSFYGNDRDQPFVHDPGCCQPAGPIPLSVKD